VLSSAMASLGGAGGMEDRIELRVARIARAATGNGVGIHHCLPRGGLSRSMPAKASLRRPLRSALLEDHGRSVAGGHRVHEA
jgi:hypothetical protein